MSLKRRGDKTKGPTVNQQCVFGGGIGTDIEKRVPKRSLSLLELAMQDEAVPTSTASNGVAQPKAGEGSNEEGRGKGMGREREGRERRTAKSPTRHLMQCKPSSNTHDY